jgi:hypothetical protein
MILSASRRTDIPAFYGEWFLNRLKAGEIAARNPVNTKQVSIIKFDAHCIDCIVFWTKNSGPFIKYLDELDALNYHYYFNWTITPYGNDIERNIDKKNVIENFISLSDRIGKEKVIWRYDPIIINKRYTADFHADQFGLLAEKLHRHTEKCVISFVDNYRFLENAFHAAGIEEPNAAQLEETANELRKIANRFSPELTLASCCEKASLTRYGIPANKCIDDALISRLTGKTIKPKKDKSQRGGCGCTESRDIGAYNTCLHDCIYCYARRGKQREPPAPGDTDSLILCDTIDRTRDVLYQYDLRRI